MGACFGLVFNVYWGFWRTPSIEQIANPETKLATEIITEDNEVLGTFFYENRTPADYEEISPNLINALVATEDERFFNHSGIDARAIARAISGLGSKGGGSTLTQQLAKMQFNEPARNIIERIGQKLGEWIIAVQLERMFTKGGNHSSLPEPIRFSLSGCWH